MTRPIGICSLCGGRVSVPTYLHSVAPPVPTCEDCHAVAIERLPTVPMRPQWAGRDMGWRMWGEK